MGYETVSLVLFAKKSILAIILKQRPYRQYGIFVYHKHDPTPLS